MIKRLFFSRWSQKRSFLSK